MTLLSYVAAGQLVRVGGSMALAAYNDACDFNNRFVDARYFGANDGFLTPVMLATIAVPILLARSNGMVRANLIFALLIAAMAVAVLTTAGNRPYECVTMGGSYEDHTSGLGEFMLGAGLLFLISSVATLVDVLSWTVHRLHSLLRARR